MSEWSEGSRGLPNRTRLHRLRRDGSTGGPLSGVTGNGIPVGDNKWSDRSPVGRTPGEVGSDVGDAGGAGGAGEPEPSAGIGVRWPAALRDWLEPVKGFTVQCLAKTDKHSDPPGASEVSKTCAVKTGKLPVRAARNRRLDCGAREFHIRCTQNSRRSGTCTLGTRRASVAGPGCAMAA